MNAYTAPHTQADMEHETDVNQWGQQGRGMSIFLKEALGREK